MSILRPRELSTFPTGGCSPPKLFSTRSTPLPYWGLLKVLTEVTSAPSLTTFRMHTTQDAVFTESYPDIWLV